ncbi:SagB/ThcOx family dehydrogenase [Candidatus Roizmanbacteria bacterium]|nr:SagB/ThcOx family dehydrogenase [Candidatus Roizmanbacteria bacterium]
MATKKLEDKFPFMNLSLSQKFHQDTKHKTLNKTLDVEDWPKEWTEINYKGYPRFEKIPLTKPKKLTTDSFDQILKERSSSRNFSSKPMTFDQLSILLYYTAGLKDDKERRFYPSAGARYPTEIYPIVFNVTGIKTGIYHYHVRERSEIQG